MRSRFASVLTLILAMLPAWSCGDDDCATLGPPCPCVRRAADGCLEYRSAVDTCPDVICPEGFVSSCSMPECIDAGPRDASMDAAP